MKTNCSNKSEKDYQTISFTRFSKNLNLVDLKVKLEKSNSTDTVHYYIITSVEFINGKFRQTGSGPNLEGDLITLCTCKHKMRACKITENDWIAGITSRDKTIIKEEEARNCLFFLIRIKELFDNQFELQTHLQREHPISLKLKDATINKFGDIFLMKYCNEDYHDVKNYFPPKLDHCHRKEESPLEWYGDIELYGKKAHKLVMGDIDYSYVWDIPKIGLMGKYQNLNKGERHSDLKDFIKQLEPRNN